MSSQSTRTYGGQGCGIQSGITRIVRTNIAKLGDVPLKGTWSAQEVGVDPNLVYRLEQGGVFKKTGVERGYNGGDSHVRLYRVTESGREVIERYREQREESDWMVPCHPGLENPRDVDGYQCGNDDCNEVWDREDVNL